MAKINFRVLLRPLCECQGYTEMSATELRVLISLIENGGCIESTAELAKMAATTEARAISTLTLLSEMGLIAPEGESSASSGIRGADGIVEEFEYRIREGEIEEESSLAVAKTIRDENLAEMISECAALFGEPALSTEHASILTALHSQYALSPEYILTLAAYMATKGKPNCATLKNKAISLHKRGIDTVEELEGFVFSGCTSLKNVTLPKSLEEIGYDAFAYCSRLTLYCASGSYAERFANSYGIGCVSN